MNESVTLNLFFTLNDESLDWNEESIIELLGILMALGLPPRCFISDSGCNLLCELIKLLIDRDWKVGNFCKESITTLARALELLFIFDQ